LLLPFPLLVAWWVSGYISRWLTIAVSRLRDHVSQIVNVRDLTSLQDDDLLSEWQEFQPLAQGLRQLTEKLQIVAVDRDILEFEIRLLDKFIITSEVVRDWKEHIALLIQEVSTILPMYALFAVFRTDEEERFALEIFWAGAPTDDMQAHFEAYARERMALHPLLGRSALLDVHHSIVNPHVSIQYDPKLIDMQTKNLMLDTPKIGGVVGMGLQSALNEDLTRSLVIESILSTLINVVGSIKAINKYTRDLEFYATRDPLTQLYNQRVFRELLDYEIGRADRKDYRFTLIMCDFDNFKLINDQYGHLFGDHMLQSFARAVASVLRKGDIFARYGGDEFCVIFPETDIDQSREVVERIMEAIRAIAEPTPDGHVAHISCSIGMACFPDHAQEAKDLFLIADNMMYKAKAIGKNQVVTPSSEEVTELYREATQKSVMLMRALEEETFIEPHFQPILTVQTGRVEIHELLMRIRQGDRLVSAGEFIELAERMGIVHKLDYLLIKKAFAVMEASAYQGVLFINLSPKALILNEFIEQIKAMAKVHHIVPERIVFEITERDTVHNLSALEKFVRELKFEGFQFAIDDFGSGFSSFHYLKHFPVDYLKIEGEFIGNMTRDYIDKAFVQSAVTLAQAVGIETVAEFVEDAETLQMVRDMGIHYAQGWFISCAMPTFMTQVPDVVLAALAKKH
jgi:diguanylate cyclase (GGDEF)-like protein